MIEEMEHWIQRREGKKISRKESQRITRRKTKTVNGELSFQKNPRNGGGGELTDKEIRNLIQENAPGLRDRSVETAHGAAGEPRAGLAEECPNTSDKGHAEKPFHKGQPERTRGL